MSRNTFKIPDGTLVTIHGDHVPNKRYLIVGLPFKMDVMYYYIKPETDKDVSRFTNAVRSSLLKIVPTRVKHITRRKQKVKTKGKIKKI